MSVRRARHARTLRRIFAHPRQADIRWSEVEAMLVAFGAVIREGRSSRVRIVLNDVRAVFHRPHPRDEMDKGSVRSLQRFLESASIEPEDKNA